MRHPRTEFHVFPRRSCVPKAPGMRAAVSLHSHSNCSRESLAFLPDLAREVKVLAPFLDRGLAQYEREHGQKLDFTKWYWRPPAAPAEVIASERNHLARRLDLPSLVSLTDHDTLEGVVR